MLQSDLARNRSSLVNQAVVAGATLPPRSSPWRSLLDPALNWVRRAPPPSIGAGLTLVNQRIFETTILAGGLTPSDVQLSETGESESSLNSVEGHSEDHIPTVGNFVLTSPSPPTDGVGLADDVGTQDSSTNQTSIEGVAFRRLLAPRTDLQRPTPRRQSPIVLTSSRNPQTPSSQRVRFLEHDIPRYDSPVQEHPALPPIGNQINGTTLDDICHNVLEIERSLQCSDEKISLSVENDDSEPPIADVEAEISRKILIIGSNYNRHARRTYTISSAITLESPSSDKGRLKESFGLRGYSVHSLLNDSFGRDEALSRVAEFLSTAKCRDVRAIVFTGHACRTEGENDVALIPPNCLDRAQAISAELWENTIRDNTQPGVIVLSIFASCFSGGFMEQGINLKNLNPVRSPNASSSPTSGDPSPILVTFTSSSPDQLSYESSIEAEHSWRPADHFLYALDMTARCPSVRDWQTFITLLESYFQDARRIGASFDETRSPEDWERDSPQTPMYTASDFVDLPTLFPDLQG
ncbi:hypothetical protein FRC12_008460 [Ceratobasidium sp. 428]|nr:hypothetical protein FRC12_008460 [Ceratobasidium sp. 428]